MQMINSILKLEMRKVMITALTKATLYNLRHSKWACADCIE
jgi:hypothetical protein